MIFHFIEKLPIKKLIKFSHKLPNNSIDSLLVANCDNPFFSHNLFAKRFLELVSTIRRISGQNRLILLESPPGCGKSTFLNNLIQKVKECASTPDGLFTKPTGELIPKQFKEFSNPKNIIISLKTAKKMEL